MTLNDLEGHSLAAGLVKCNPTSICATFRTVLTDTARRAVPRRLLSILFCLSAPLRNCVAKNVNKRSLLPSGPLFYVFILKIPGWLGSSLACWTQSQKGLGSNRSLFTPIVPLFTKQQNW